MVDPPDGRTWREHNIRIKDLYLHPEEDKWIFNPGFKNYLRGETIVETVREEDEELQSSFKKWQTHNEYKESRLSPELDEGDTILVIDRDKERESGKTKYTTPAKELRPERYVPYVVIYKETAGSKSPWPFKYILIPEDRHQDYLDDPYSKEVEEIQKLLFPWIYQWIHSDTPMATNVDRKTIQQQRKLGIISEHKESRLNPKLKVGDEIMVVKVGDTAPNKQTIPEKYIRYFVTKIYHGDEWHTYPYSQTYYGLNRPDVDVTDPERPGVGEGDVHKYLFPDTDKWIFNPEAPTMDYKDAFQLNEHGADDSWSDDGDTITLQEILELTKDIKIIDFPTKELAPKVLRWEDNPEEIERISQVEVSRQYPILIMVNEYNEVQWVLDGNHRAQQALINDIPTIPAKLIKPSDLDERSIKMFYPDGIPDTENLNKLTESLTEHKESRLNPQLMIGDEILVVSSKGIHDFGSPELYEPYVVVGIKYSH